MSLNAALNSTTYASSVNLLMSALTGYDNYYGIPEEQPSVAQVGALSPTAISADIAVQRSQGFGPSFPA